MSRKNWNAGTLLAPVPPVMVTCGNEEIGENVLTVGWTGILNTKPPKTYISVRPSRYSYGLIKESGEFVINLTPSSLVRACDKAGCVTGKGIDKFEKCGLTKIPSSVVGCPSIAECPISLECKVTNVTGLGSHDMFVADIVAVTVDEKLINPDGKLMIEKAGLCAYAHGTYFELGKKIGTFGFSVKKKKKQRTKK